LALADYAQRETFDLVCVTPDDPLALGLVDLLTQKGIPAFGPVAAAAQIEASKAFCKNLLAKYGIPTAAFAVFDDAAIAKEYLASQPVPVVVKADGLALGKGVFICQTHAEAENAIDEIMVKKAFGASGLRVVIEEFMTGPEVSLLFFCDGTHVVPMPAAQDHKRVYDGDKGPNTGGMGAFAPTPMLTKMLYEEVLATIVMPTVNAMKAEGREFRGILYCGLMLTPNGPRVLEYNARFGDPETQAILPLMETPLTEAMFACMNGTLDHADIRFSDGACVCIAAASGGYPGQYERGFEITGLDRAQARGAQVFHAGTAARDGGFVTDGGRVLGVVQCAPTLGEAIKKAYEAVGEISFEGMHFRRDIGVK
jgi:phosphoribosylamine--glycine ligase